jgi:hypothetical protein
MNYIRHLTAVFERFNKDQRLNPSHVSMYYALFQYWNVFRFCNQFYVQREEIMQASKIGSLKAYHKCIRELSQWNYILYVPSHNPYRGSQVKLFVFETSWKQVGEKYEKSSERPVVHEINNIKHDKTYWPKSEFEVFKFFKENGWPDNEASKFYLHYEAVGWKINRNTQVVNWQALAQRWIKKAEEIQQNLKLKNPDYLKLKKEKNYGKPL